MFAEGEDHSMTIPTVKLRMIKYNFLQFELHRSIRCTHATVGLESKWFPITFRFETPFH